MLVYFTMSNKLIFFFVLLLSLTFVFAWTPTSNIDLRNFYNITNGDRAEFNCINLSGEERCTWSNGSGETYYAGQDIDINGSNYISVDRGTIQTFFDTIYVKLTNLPSLVVSYVGNFSDWDKNYDDLINTPVIVNGTDGIDGINGTNLFTSLNETQFDNSTGTLNIVVSWLSDLFDGKANYQFEDNNFNGSGNFTGDYLFGNLSWNYLYDYPVACPAGSSITQLGDSVVCSSFAQENTNVTFQNITGDYFIGDTANFTSLIVGNANITGLLYGNGSQLTGLPETDLTGYAEYQFGANSFNGSGNFTTSGRIGIGTATPIRELHVVGDVLVKGYVYSEQCPDDMAYISSSGGYCIDKWEASMPSATSEVMGSAGDMANRNNPGSMAAVSQSGVVPWVRVSQVSASTACENAGKRLCSGKEWLGAANVQGKTYYLPTDLAVAPYYCVTGASTYCTDNSYESGEACDTGTYSGGASGCYSAEGVYDMTGNVWEWTDEEVDVVNPDGVAGWKYANANGEWQTSTSGLWNKYGNDGTYFPVTTPGRAVLRGGSWSYGAHAGPFSAHLYYAPTTTYYNMGFRCCSS